MDLGLSGLASGFDWKTFVDQMVDVERAPQKRLLIEQNTLRQEQNAYGGIKTQLAVLQARVDALKDPDLFTARTVSSGDDSIASAKAGSGTQPGQFTFVFSQLAAAARLNGGGNIGSPLSTTNDVSAVVLGSAGLATPITAGTITVNGAQVQVETTDTMQDVFNKIESATGGTVSGSYDAATDRISLTALSGTVTLGSTTDTSNFLKATRLFNNGTGTVTSSAALGGVRKGAVLSEGNFATAISDGGAGAGVFKINGVEISFNASTDTLSKVIDRINGSGAGVTASYDTVNDRLILTNKSTGDVGIAVEDVTGNFAAATGLTSGTLERGKNLLYSINGGPELVSESNTITAESSGIEGLTVTALKQETTTITVGSDTDKIKAAITDFITEFNRVQSIIETNTASSTDGDGKVTAGTLAKDSTAGEIGSALRAAAFKTLSGFSIDMNQLADLGISTSGTDNSLTLTDEEALDSALANNLSGVLKLFTDEQSGLAVSLSAYIEKTAGEEGTLLQKTDRISKDIASIDTQISDMERLVQAHRDRLTESFVTMEAAQAQINQQLQFLAQRFGTAAK